MPKKTVEKGRHVLRYADFLHKQLVAEAKEEYVTYGAMLIRILEKHYALKGHGSNDAKKDG